jgi:LytS/YehU family sensor histidine kinase
LAIHEKAERTSEAIEKLGSMMRFMLQENVQEKISLNRDLEYLHNYIALQRLRTDINTNIRIQITIPQSVDPAMQIAPMLLIPFIENAFKHGISLREESQIRVSLELNQSTLYFDVFNTKHIRPENDPEKNSNGIGLMNVKQRLQLVYPGKHELVIRETTHGYFVHLVINLG